MNEIVILTIKNSSFPKFNSHAQRQKRKTQKTMVRASRLFDIPQDIPGGLLHIEMTGDREVFVENHKGILALSENEVILAFGKAGHTVKNRKKGSDVIFTKLAKSPSKDQNPCALIRQRQQHRLAAHRPALAATSGTAEGYVSVSVRQECPLPL